MNIPYNYNYENVLDSTLNPSAVTVTKTGTANFFRRYLLQKAMSVFKWDFPKTWSKEYFLYTLYCTGCVAIINTDKFGVIPQQCVPFGYNVFYQPNQVNIANPLLGGIKSPVIGEQCTIFKMTADWGGIMDLVRFYGDYMALIAQGVGVNIINTKLAYVFGAEDNASAESFKKASDQVESGAPFVVVSKKMFKDNGDFATPFFEQNLSQNFITPELLDAWRTVENMFCTAVGIPNANQNKKERMIVDEVNANNTETVTLCDMWLESWKESIEKTVDMFGESARISVDWRNKPEKDVKSNENGDNVDTRAV